MDTLDQLLALTGQTRSDLPTTGVLGGMVRATGAAADERVFSLARRAPATEQEIDLLSAWLRKTPDVRLRPAQVEALRELFECRGIFAPMRVGSGKTLVTLAAPYLLGSERPVLIVPASLREKTRRDYANYHRDWHVRLPRLISYQELGRPDRENMLLELEPDLLILDEAHHARNLDAAVTRRIKRCIEALRPVVAVLSGTLITDKLMDYHHLAVWSLHDLAPVPLKRSVAEQWALAVDREVGALKRVAPGALASLPGGFHEWFRGSRGVIPTPGSDCTAAIQITTWRPKLPQALKDTIELVTLTSERPDGEPLDEWELPDCLCQLALGFYYVWDPMPPDWWLRPRRGWRAYARAVLDEHLPGFDSESMIVSALDSGRGGTGADHEGAELLAGWRAVRDQFVPNPVPVWIDDAPLRQAAAHAKNHLIWVKHRAAGFRLQELGIPYYPGGTDPESAPPNTAIALSSSPTRLEGLNMQAWHQNLVLAPPANASAWEQLIGRTHRQGQRADTIGVEIITAIPYHGEVLSRVLAEARNIQRASGFDQKLCLADWA